MHSRIFLMLFGLASSTLLAVSSDTVTSTAKHEFLKLIHRLPTDGEFFTDKAVRKAAPRIPVLFTLTPEDLGQMEIYPFAALSRGLFDMPKYRQYGLDHFGDIAHPELKLFWAAMLFDSPLPVSAEVVSYLRAAVASEKSSKDLAEIVGPDWPAFKERVIKYEVPSN